MQQLSDPPSAAQVAQMLERLTNVVDDLKEIKAQQGEMNRNLAEMVGVQRDITHLNDQVKNLSDVADERGKMIPAMDNRIRSLERWHKFVWTAVIASFGIVGWGVDKISYLYKMDNRISMLELIVNGRGVERAMTPDSVPAPTPVPERREDR